MMLLSGIICEYNPFHNGHLAHIEKTRELSGEDTGIICVMSGNFVQRGEAAIMRKHARAEMAVRGGADLVLELPIPWATASAEKFAFGGVAVLNLLGVPMNLSFGSECADIEKMTKAADMLISDRAYSLIRDKMKDGTSYAAARQWAANMLLGDDADILRYPNNILGVEYIKAIKALNAPITPMTFERILTEHDGAETDDMAPASRIREMLMAGKTVEKYMPQGALDILNREIGEGRCPAGIRSCEEAVLYRLRTMTTEEYMALPDSSEGLWMRLQEAGSSSKTYEELIFNTKSKRYTLSRIRRMVLSSYLGISKEMSDGLPPYIRILAFNERGRKILHELKNTAKAPVITKPAFVHESNERVKKIFELEARATSVYSLMYPDKNNRSGKEEWTVGPVFVDCDKQ